MISVFYFVMANSEKKNMKNVYKMAKKRKKLTII